jgi:hypothetical protein
MEGYGIYPDAPEMPFVTLTLLINPLRFVVRPLFGFGSWLLRVLYYHWNDWTPNDRVLNPIRAATNSITGYISRATSEADLSITDDEILG